MSASRRRCRALRGLVVGSVGSLAVLVPANQLVAEHADDTRIVEWADAERAGAFTTDPVARALAWSSFVPDGSAPEAMLGRDDLFADSLAAATAQAEGRPLLLTARDDLDDRVVAELERLGTNTVHILGGEQAVLPAVEQALESEGFETNRVFGATRIETAIAIAREFAPGEQSAVVVRAFGADDPTQAFADSLAAGAWAAGRGSPVLLTETAALSPATQSYIDEAGIAHFSIFGGTAAVGPAVESSLQAFGATERMAGFDRFDTAADASEDFGVELVLVDGSDPAGWADGFAAAGYAATRFAPVVLSSGDTVPPPTIDRLLGSHEPNVKLVCGPSVTDAACRSAEIASQTATTAHYRPVAVMTAEQEVPGPGFDGRHGLAEIFFSSEPTTVCYRIATFGIPYEQITMSHIHHGVRGVAGPIVVGLPLGTIDDGFAGCAQGPEVGVVEYMQQYPEEYYVNVHTGDHPAGAIRGQLIDVHAELGATLNGGGVVPGPGENEPSAFVTLYVPGTGTTLCAATVTRGFESLPTGLHLGRGAAGEPGAVVAEFPTPAPESNLNACTTVPAEVLVELAADPAAFHMTIPTSNSPGGAVRGQLVHARSES